MLRKMAVEKQLEQKADIGTWDKHSKQSIDSIKSLDKRLIKDTWEHFTSPQGIFSDLKNFDFLDFFFAFKLISWQHLKNCEKEAQNIWKHEMNRKKLNWIMNNC